MTLKLWIRSKTVDFHWDKTERDYCWIEKSVESLCMEINRLKGILPKKIKKGWGISKIIIYKGLTRNQKDSILATVFDNAKYWELEKFK